jgi:hypothetical protein
MDCAVVLGPSIAVRGSNYKPAVLTHIANVAHGAFGNRIVESDIVNCNGDADRPRV